jgi:hypothetical protein
VVSFFDGSSSFMKTLRYQCSSSYSLVLQLSTLVLCGRLLIKGYINKMCGEAPTALRMGPPPPTTNFVGLSGKLTETQRHGVIINAPYQSHQHACKLEDFLEMQPQRFVMLGINVDTYTAVVWVTSHFLGPLSIWWLTVSNGLRFHTLSTLWLQLLVRRPCCPKFEMTQSTP